MPIGFATGTARRVVRRVSTLLVAVAVILCTSDAGAEPFSTLYLGLASTADEPYTIDGTQAPPALTCISSCSSALSPVGGIRVGYWFERVPWLGIAGDFSAFIANWGFESPAKVIAYPLTPMIAVRGRLIDEAGYENGRVQPYIAVGPSMFISKATVSKGYALLGTSSQAEATGVAVALDVRVGVEILTAEWFGVNIEYRYTYAKPRWDLEGEDFETELSTSHFVAGISAHY